MIFLKAIELDFIVHKTRCLLYWTTFFRLFSKSSIEQDWAFPVNHKIAITIRIQRVTMSTKVVTMNIKISEKCFPKHLGTITSSLSCSFLLFNTGIWQTNNFFWSEMSLRGPMLLSGCPLSIWTESDESWSLFCEKILRVSSAQSSHLALR